MKVCLFSLQKRRKDVNGEYIYTHTHTCIYSGMHISPLCQHIFFPLGESGTPAPTRDGGGGDMERSEENPFSMFVSLVSGKQSGSFEVGRTLERTEIPRFVDDKVSLHR